MRLKVTNFKYHVEGEWNFIDNGLTLLKGPRGEGKTSVLKAILYALFGSYAVKKPCTFGTNKATVELEIGPLVIKRCSRPKKLEVICHREKESVSYDGDEAQGIIEKWLDMSMNEFMYSCYIKQKSDGSILSLGPADQLNYIESIVFKGNSPKEIQTNIKNALKKNEIERQNLTNNLEVQTKLLETYNEILKTCPIGKCPIDDSETYIPDETRLIYVDQKTKVEERLARYQKRCEGFSQELEKAREIDTELHQLKTDKQTTEATINRIQKDIEDLESKDLDLEELQSYERRIQEIENIMNMNQKCLDLALKKKELNTFNLETNDHLKGEMETIQTLLKQAGNEEEIRIFLEDVTTVKPEYTKTEAINEAKKIIPLIRKSFDLPKGVKTIPGVVDALSEYHKEMEGAILKLNNSLGELNIKLGKCEITSKTYECPGCNLELQFENSKLVPYDSQSSREMQESITCDIERATKKISEEKSSKELCEKYISKLKILLEAIREKRKYMPHDEVEKYRKKLDDIIGLKAQYQSLNSKLEKSNNPTYNRMEDEIRKLETTIPQTFKMLSEKEEKKLKSNLTDLTNKLTIYYSDQGKVQSLKVELEGKRKILGGIDRRLNQLGKSTPQTILIEKKIARCRSEINKMWTQITDMSILIRDCEDYDNYLKAEKNVEKTKLLAEEIEKKQNNLIVQMEKLSQLKDLSVKAEHVAIQQVIEDINRYSNYWLERMFEKEPMSISLESVKEIKNGKDTKLQMNCVVHYKNHKYDSVSSLSGGERDQANLAFMLGINDMLGGKILLLDESIASLDTETGSSSLELIKETIVNKPIIVVEHQAITGVFNQQIDF